MPFHKRGHLNSRMDFDRWTMGDRRDRDDLFAVNIFHRQNDNARAVLSTLVLSPTGF